MNETEFTTLTYDEMKVLSELKVIEHYDHLLRNNYEFCATDLIAPSKLGYSLVIEWFHVQSATPSNPNSMNRLHYELFDIPRKPLPSQYASMNHTLWSINTVLDYLPFCQDSNRIKQVLNVLFRNCIVEISNRYIGQELIDDFIKQLRWYKDGTQVSDADVFKDVIQFIYGHLDILPFGPSLNCSNDLLATYCTTTAVSSTRRLIDNILLLLFFWSIANPPKIVTPIDKRHKECTLLRMCFDNDHSI